MPDAIHCDYVFDEVAAELPPLHNDAKRLD